MKLVALVAGLLAACSGSASRESPRPDARESPRPDARDSAPRATPSTTAREPVRADPTPTADAGSGQPVAAPAPAAPPVRCTATAPPATVAVLQRLPGGLDVAVHAGRTGLVWQEGPIAKVLVLDEAGQPTGQATALNEAGSWAGGAQIFAAAEAFAVTYVHKYGRSLQGCDFVARTVAIDATAGEPVVLAANVCAQSGYPVATATSGAVVAALTKGYEGQGLDVVRWPLAGAPERTASPGVGILTTPLRVEPVTDGFYVVWENDADQPLFSGLRLDAGARAVGETEQLRVGRFGPPWIVGGRPHSLRLQAGAAELRALDAARGAGWNAIDAGGRVREARVVATGGRSWVVARMLGGGHRAVPMAADATQAGPAFDLPGTAFAVDGGRGAAAELRSSPRELVWAGLSCEAAAP